MTAHRAFVLISGKEKSQRNRQMTVTMQVIIIQIALRLKGVIYALLY